MPAYFSGSHQILPFFGPCRCCRICDIATNYLACFQRIASTKPYREFESSAARHTVWSILRLCRTETITQEFSCLRLTRGWAKSHKPNCFTQIFSPESRFVSNADQDGSIRCLRCSSCLELDSGWARFICEAKGPKVVGRRPLSRNLRVFLLKFRGRAVPDIPGMAENALENGKKPYLQAKTPKF